MRKRTFVLGIISIAVFVVGGIFQIMHLAGANILWGSGLLLFLFGFLFSFVIDKVSIESRKVGRLALFLLFITIGLVILYIIFLTLHVSGVKPVGFGATLMAMIFLVFISKHLEGRQLIIRADRQLASILFTDIVGYTSLMGKDESKALQYLEDNRRIQKRLIRKHRGKWLKEMGDGSIAIFYTASEAVLCALEIQKEINAKKSFELRMGVHISEIVFTDSDVFGDGVNVASRISEIAGPGEICFSEAVLHNIRNREDLAVTPMGEREFKNVSYKLKVYKLETLNVIEAFKKEGIELESDS